MHPEEHADEVALAGGIGSGGAVVRVGDTVRRPIRPRSAAVAAFLRHLEAVGFEGAPRHLHLDKRAEVVAFIDGGAAVPALGGGQEALLLGVARLQRELHAAAATFTPPAGATWDRANLPDAGPGAIVCHNDLCVENVVVRDGRVVAFIDFSNTLPCRLLRLRVRIADRRR